MQETGFARYPKLEPDSKSMMKTKLTLFVAVIAVALFGVGCASTDSTNKAEVSGKSTDDPLKKGLVVHLTFSGNSQDDSGNGNHGGVSGATLSTDRHGENGKAYSFDGVDDYIKVASNRGLKGVKRITLSFWIKIKQEELPGDEGWISPINWWDGYNGHADLKWSFWTGIRYRKEFGIFVAPNTTSGPTISNSIKTSVWLHIVYSHDSSGAILSFDGKQVKMKKDAPIKLPSLDIPLYIGATFREQGKFQYPFYGSIDDVRVYNRALSADEVKALYDLEKPKGK